MAGCSGGGALAGVLWWGCSGGGHSKGPAPGRPLTGKGPYALTRKAAYAGRPPNKAPNEGCPRSGPKVLDSNVI